MVQLQPFSVADVPIEAQRERIVDALRDPQVRAIIGRLRLNDKVHSADVERAFLAHADAGEWNRRHPDRLITWDDL